MNQLISLLVSFLAITNFERIFKVYTEEDMFNIISNNAEYCDIRCLALLNKHHISCDCPQRLAHHEEIPQDSNLWLKFRTSMLDVHNNLRNMVASGVPYLKLPQASNLLIINYDMELEYISRCFARQYYLLTYVDDTHCLVNLDDVSLGKVEFRDPNLFDSLDWFIDATTDVTEKTITSYGFGRDRLPNDVLLILWWSIDHIGCSQINFPDSQSAQLVLCLYKGDYDGGRIEDEPVYEIGPGCSNCPEEFPCAHNKSKYGALCGEHKPIPDYVFDLPLFSFEDFTVKGGWVHNSTEDTYVAAEANAHWKKHGFILYAFSITVAILIQ